eukprot:TRINITY_DN1801_c0_g3_i1.p1 TRINITY_DN1801_c0_g3~~TRINITY_DN1801_c0_g3_i1.p1  ORF type:complete len:199 (-),score=39.77 TRINITY_DN1801_c0_g3_i1:22-618(-)
MAIISVLVGSVRIGRQGIKVANWIAKQIKARGHTVHVIDPVVYTSLQTFEERFRFLKEPKEDLVKVQQLIEESESFVVVTAEYFGMFTPQLKMIFDFFLNEWKSKPFGIISYSMGPYAGGRANFVLRAELSTIGGFPTPLSIAIPTVQNQFDDNGDLKDEGIKKSTEAFLFELEWFTSAISNQRKVDGSLFPKAVKLV